MSIKIVTDSTADLPAPLVKELGITVVPLKVNFSDGTYREGLDITSQAFYEKLGLSERLPTTSQPSPGEFQEVYSELTADGAAVISIHISQAMSGTCQAASLAKNAMPEKDITVVDSKQVSMALGLVVIEAARAARDGKTRDEILQLVADVSGRVRTYFVVDTLEYLQKGGRIGKASAFLGTMLNIKPVLTIEDGIIAPFEKIRGKQKALDRIIEITKAFEEEHGPINLAMVHSNCLDELVKFLEKVNAEIKYRSNIISEIGAVVGSHCGPGTIAVFFNQAG